MKEMRNVTLKEEWRDEVLDTLYPQKKSYRVPIDWILVPFKMARKKGVMRFGQGKRKIFLGFCMATERLIKIQPIDSLGLMAALLIRDTFVETENGKPEGCEEERRCLNIDCPINRTTKESFVSSIGIDEKTAKRMKWEAATSYRKITWEEVTKERLDK